MLHILSIVFCAATSLKTAAHTCGQENRALVAEEEGEEREEEHRRAWWTTRETTSGTSRRSARRTSSKTLSPTSSWAWRSSPPGSKVSMGATPHVGSFKSHSHENSGFISIDVYLNSDKLLVRYIEIHWHFYKTCLHSIQPRLGVHRTALWPEI